MAIALDLIAAHGAVDLSFRRVLPVARTRVWAAWTEAERFSRWFGPHGTTIDPCEIDARVGGTLFFCHRHADIPAVWVRGEFIEVEAPSRLVFLVGFADPDGNPLGRTGFASESRIEITLQPHAVGTEMRVRHTGLTSDQGEGIGWRQSLERLDTLLSIQED